MLGTSFHDVPLAELEKIERESESIRARLFATQNSSDAPTHDTTLAGGVVLSTCNRFEVYLETKQFYDAIEHTINAVSYATGLPTDYVSKVLHVSHGSAVAQHLFAVSSGLESMLVGEAEIAGQVKRAFADAQAATNTSPLLERLFQNSMAVSKRVTNATGLGEAGRSVVTAALDLHQNRYGSVLGKKILVIGTGAYARVVVAALKRIGAGEILIYSHTGRAKLFSETHQTTAVKAGELVKALIEADLVISASRTRDYLLTTTNVGAAVAARQTDLHIIDMALSSDVSPDAANLPGVEVIDLEYVRANAAAESTEAILAAQDLVREAVEKFESEEASRTIDPAVAALRAHVGAWVEAEVERVRRRSGDEAAGEVEHSLNRVTNALLHTPSINAKSLAKNGNHNEYVRAIKTLFNIDLGQLNDAD